MCSVNPLFSKNIHGIVVVVLPQQIWKYEHNLYPDSSKKKNEYE